MKKPATPLENVADEYLKKVTHFYGSRVNYNVKEFVRGFARYLSKNQPKPNSNRRQYSQVAFITENNSHLTGGRYYAYFMAAALHEAGLDVTIYTNNRPSFIDFFEDYQLPKIEVIPGTARSMESIDIKADIYIGSPISGNVIAIKNAKRYHKQAYVMIFDPFPMMKRWMNKEHFAGWGELVKLMKETDCKILSLCNATAPYINDWLDKTDDDIIPIYPCINSRKKDKTPRPKRGNYAIFVSRIVPNKRFNHVLAACKTNRLDLKVIASTSGLDERKMVRQYGMDSRVEFIKNASEEEKFKLIKGAAVMINGAIFEGFGMWMAEAIDCGTPVVCYDYPTLREIQHYSGADNIYFAKHNDPKSLSDQLAVAMSERKFKSSSNHFGFDKMVERVSEVFKIEPKIGVVTIALNEGEFIKSSLKSVITHKNIHKIAVVEGAVDLFPTHKNYLSIDDTAEQVFEVMSGAHGSKIVFDRYGRATDKAELRNRGLELLTDCDYILILDADELYTHEDLDKLVEAIKANPSTQTFVWPFYHFWKNFKQVTTGSQWDVMLPRFFKFADKDTRFHQHNLFPVNSEGKRLSEISKEQLDIHVYHLGYCKDPKRVQDKLIFYKNRDKDLKVKDTYTNWKPGQETQPTHQGGIVKKFDGDYPPEMRKLKKYFK